MNVLLASLAREYDVSATAVYLVIKGATWRVAGEEAA